MSWRIWIGSLEKLTPPINTDNISESAHFKITGFVTHATKMADGENKNQVLYKRWASAWEETIARASQEKGSEFLGYFNCQGAPTPPIEDFIHREILPDEGEWQTYITNVRNHPDEEDLNQAKTFAREVLSNIP